MGPDASTAREKVLAAAWLFEAGVGNGGFIGYLTGKRGQLAREAPAALREIGAPHLAALAEEANAVFGEGGPPADRSQRQRQLRAQPDVKVVLARLYERYAHCEEDIDELLDAFLSRHSEPRQ
jgi:hypothetical protein